MTPAMLRVGIKSYRHQHVMVVVGNLPEKTSSRESSLLLVFIPRGVLP
jgi:hypothetical protein